MRKVFVLFIVMSLIFLSEANSQVIRNKSLERAHRKEFKAKLKQYEKGGWKVDGTARTIEVKLLEHYASLDSNPNNREYIGTCSQCISKNVCRETALNNVLREYAEKSGSYVKGRVESDLQNNASSKVSGEFDKLYAAYERLISKEIKGEIQESFSIIHDKGDSKEYESYFILNEDSASKARMRAMQQAAEETKLAQEYAQKISDFVNGYDK